MLPASAPVKANKRISSLDGVKGFLSLKIALAHVGFFVAVPWLTHITGFGRMLSFPVLLFAFGVGTGISRRKKPAWPLMVLAAALLAASVLNEAFVDACVARGLPIDSHPMAGGPLSRFLSVATLSHSAHYADFLQPYLLFLFVALVFDRLKLPLRNWKPSLLLGAALAMHLAGIFLASRSYSGPLSVLWKDGYRSFQYAPLFAAGILVGAYRRQWLSAKEHSKLRAAAFFVLFMCGTKLAEYATIFFRPIAGSHNDLWKEGDIFANIGGLIAGLLLFAAYAELKQVLSGSAMQAIERVGKRAIVSICIQMITLPLFGLIAVHFGRMPVRAAIGLGGWLFFALLILNWDRLMAAFRAKPDRAVVDLEAMQNQRAEPVPVEA